MRGDGGRAELGLAAILILVALGLDFLWLQPTFDRLDDLTNRRNELRSAVAVYAAAGGNSTGGPAGASVSDASRSSGNARSLPDHAAGSAVPDAEDAGADNPAWALAAAQAGSRLVQRELRLADQQTRGPVQRSAYYLEIYGSFREVHGFLRKLETGPDLVVVDQFRMVTASEDPGVTLFLWATVLTEAG